MDGWDVKGIEFNRLVGGMINSALLVDADAKSRSKIQQSNSHISPYSNHIRSDIPYPLPPLPPKKIMPTYPYTTYSMHIP
ncbi:hypothetical protein VTJ04DRAFT_9613 [Mycothermus thermophilus]|uniref:uncharacterized protein n=1 Tax=Humicola insolens TaxID=85995 RepID=UPI0037444AB4